MKKDNLTSSTTKSNSFSRPNGSAIMFTMPKPKTPSFKFNIRNVSNSVNGNSILKTDNYYNQQAKSLVDISKSKILY